MKRTNRILISTILVSALVGFSIPAFGAGENMLHTSAGRTYAGFGYTHGNIPVSEGVGGFYDDDIMRYDINNLKRANYYYTQEDLEYHTDGNQGQNYYNNQQ
jgi:hypothetical protein